MMRIKRWLWIFCLTAVLLSQTADLGNKTIDGKAIVKFGDAAGGKLSGTYPNPGVSLASGDIPNNAADTSGAAAKMPTYTVSTLPAAGTAGRIAKITDAFTAGSCTVGGGSYVVICVDNGAAWIPTTVALAAAATLADGATALAADPSDCTNQFARGINASGAAQCATVVSTDTDTSIAHTGADINTSHQVSATHLAAALPLAQGGTALTAVPGSNTNYIYNNSGVYGAKALLQAHAVGCGVGDPAGSALSTGILCYVVAPVACTIQSWDILVDSGTATADIWKIATGTAIPTVSNSIVASAAPAISTGTAIHSTTMTSWTTSVAQYDIFGFNLTTNSGPKYIYVGVNCDETK